MTLLTSIQDKINSKIFTRLGSTVTRTPYTSQSVDKWGDATISYDSTEDISAIPYSMIDKRTEFQPFGDTQEGEIIMAFKYNQTLNVKDKVTFDSKDFLVRQVEKFPLQDGFIVKIVRLVEQLN